jgi:uncharacterized protein
VKSKKEYIIPFIGLKLGVHAYDFDMHDAFFEEREYALIHKGNVNVKLLLEKKETMMIGQFSISGTVLTDCDRCTDKVSIPVKGEYRLVYKFDTEPSDDESLFVLHPDEYELDLQDNIYELITVSLPTRLLHPKGECNEEMLALMEQYMIQQPANEQEERDEDEEDWEDWDDDLDDDDDEELLEEDNLEEDIIDEDNLPTNTEIDPRWNALKNLNKNNI